MIDLAKILAAKKGYTILGDVTSNRIRDHKLISELKRYDDENHGLILKESKEYLYDKLGQALYAKSQFWRAAMKKLGIKAVEEFHSGGADQSKLSEFETKLVQQMKEKQVHIEERNSQGLDVKEDGWKSGSYVYYQGDIVYFISNPHSKRKFRSGIYVVGQVDFCLRTNAPNVL